MEGHRFDELARSLGTSTTRRGLLKGCLGIIAGALAGSAATRGAAQGTMVTQAYCGNQFCDSNPGGCKPGCVCCVYTNAVTGKVINSRCRPPGTCNPGTTVCPAGQTYCSDLGRCAECCTNAQCPTPADPCRAAVCQSGVCNQIPANEGGTCNDGDLCTKTDTCRGGVCVGGDPVVCRPLDQCHVAGTCDPLTGTCSNPNAPNGVSCNDTNACTTGDTCQAGACTGGTTVSCTTDNPCLSASCDPVRGCVTTPKGRGEACGNGIRCDGDEICDGAGTCVPGTPVSCGSCLACDPASGSCVAANEGSACSGSSDKCFETFVCRAGTCVGEQPTDCTATDQCHAAGTCDPNTGLCSNPDQPDGTDCEDGDLCTGGDSCQAGVCRPGIFPTLCFATTCAPQSTCNPSTGQCEATATAPNGTDCSSPFDACSTSECQDGACVATSTVDCSHLDTECGIGQCDGVTGNCTVVARPGSHLTPCDGQNRCNTFLCAGGSCVDFGPAVTCDSPPYSVPDCSRNLQPRHRAMLVRAGARRNVVRGSRKSLLLNGICQCDGFCEGLCLSTQGQCCGRIFQGEILFCEATTTCCPADVAFLGSGCCTALQRCTETGCI